jgi:hypothetical protein
MIFSQTCGIMVLLQPQLYVEVLHRGRGTFGGKYEAVEVLKAYANENVPFEAYAH